MRCGGNTGAAACSVPASGAPRCFRPAGGRLPAFAAALLLLLLFVHGCAKYPSSTSPPGGTVAGQAISRTARSLAGVPYSPGGNSPDTGFDCSGLVSWVYARHGVSLPRTAEEQKNIGRPVRASALQPGDVLVFSIRRGAHTGIYTGGGKFIHSPSRGKAVREENLNHAYWQDRFIEGRRHSQVQ